MKLFKQEELHVLLSHVKHFETLFADAFYTQSKEYAFFVLRAQTKARYRVAEVFNHQSEERLLDYFLRALFMNAMQSHYLSYAFFHNKKPICKVGHIAYSKTIPRPCSAQALYQKLDNFIKKVVAIDLLHYMNEQWYAPLCLMREVLAHQIITGRKPPLKRA